MWRLWRIQYLTIGYIYCCIPLYIDRKSLFRVCVSVAVGAALGTLGTVVALGTLGVALGTVVALGVVLGTVVALGTLGTVVALGTVGATVAHDAVVAVVGAGEYCWRPLPR